MLKKKLNDFSEVMLFGARIQIRIYEKLAKSTNYLIIP